MDKYEYKVRSGEISKLIEKEKYAEAVKIADTIDWRRVKSATMLLKIAALYRVSRRNEDSREILMLAYERYPSNRSVVYSLCELSIELDDVVAAIEYYKQFVKLVPKDNGVYTLRYRILEAQEASLEERIEILEELKKKDYQEEWAYELAYLYHRVGLSTKCVEECDDIILWFGDGAYVMKAMELKAKHVPLTDAQLQNYNIMLGNAGQNYSSGNYDAGNYDAGDYNAGGYDGQNYDSGYAGESYDNQNYDSGYAGESYADQNYDSGYDGQDYDSGYHGEGYDGEGYADQNYGSDYNSEGYAGQNYDPGYNSEGYAGQNYDSGYAGESYDNQNYDSGYAGESYADQNYDPGYNGAGYDSQNYDPGYGGEGYVDQNYDSNYSGESYNGQNYSGGGYDQGYPAESYDADNYAGQGYGTGNYDTQGYTTDNNGSFYADGQENYSEQQYTQNNYVDDGYGNLSYVDNSYQDNGYTGEFYVEQAYDENGNLIDPDRYTDNYPYPQNAQSQDTAYAGQTNAPKEYRNGLHLVETPAAPAANSGDMSQYNTINLQKVVAESMKELFPDDNEDVFAEDREKYNSGETVRDKSGDTRIFAGMKEQPAGAQTTGRVNIAQMVTGVSEAAPEPHTGAIKKVFVPGGDARPIKSDSNMEELRDTTEESVEDEHVRMESNDENVYHEKSLLSTDEEEKAPTGPMKLDKVLVEWERMKQDNAKKNQEQIKKRVITQTGKIFADFDNSIKSGILGELEREEAKAERKNQESTVKKRKDSFLDADITGDIPQQPVSDDDFDVSYVTEQNHPAKSQGESDRSKNKADDFGDRALFESEELHMKEVPAENAGDDIEQEYSKGTDAYTRQEYSGDTDTYTAQGTEEDANTYTEQAYVEGAGEDTAQGYLEDTDAYTQQDSLEDTDAYTKGERSKGKNAYTQQDSLDGAREYPEQEYSQDTNTYIEQAAVKDADAYIDEMDIKNAGAYTEEIETESAGTDQAGLYAGDLGQRTEEIDIQAYTENDGYIETADTQEADTCIQTADTQDTETHIGTKYPYVEDAEEYTDQDYEKDTSELYTDQDYEKDEESYDMPYMEEEEYPQEGVDSYAEEYPQEGVDSYIDEYYEEDPYEDLEDAYSDTYEDARDKQRCPNDQYNERALDPEEAESIAEMAKEDALKTQEIKMNTADLSSLSEKIVATTKKEANGAKREEIRDFTSEEQNLFENFAVTKKIKKQIIYALENMTLAAYTGNVILTGDAGLDTMRMAKNLIKEYQAADENFSGKLAKITGEKINQRNIKDIFEKLNNGGIIIEKANGMTEEKLYELAINLNQDTLGIVVIMEDTKKEITKLLEKQAMIVDYFDIRIDLMEMDNNALVAYAKNYALALEYSIDELGTLALYTRIANMQSGNHVVTKDEVRDIIDEAIWKSKKSKIKNFVDVLFARRYDDEDMIVLKERDFM